MYLPTMFPVLYDNSAPMVELLDLRSNTADLTTYTFAGSCINLGTVASIAGDTYAANPQVRSRGKRFIVVNVHGMDALTVFTVSTCSIGGVNGTKLADAGSESQLVLAATFVWDTNALQGITNTDVVVTFSEAVTSCAVGVLSVSNIGVFQNVTTHTWSSASDTLSMINTPAPALIEHNALLIGAGTFNGANATPVLFENSAGSAAGAEGSRSVEILYTGGNAEMSYYCGWSYSPQYNFNNPVTAGFRVDYTGAAFEASVGLGFV